MVVTHSVNFVADDGAAVVLLSFLEQCIGRGPCFVDQVKDFNGVGVGFIARLGRVNVDTATDEKDLVGCRKVG